MTIFQRIRLNSKRKKIIKALEGMVGKYNSGLLISILCDGLNRYVSGVEARDMRTLEVKINDYFSLKYDFDKERYIDAD